MEIRKRLRGKDIKHSKKEELINQKDVEDEEVIAGIPPRRKVHSKARRSAFSLPSLKSGIPITMGLLLLVGGIWWFIDQDFFAGFGQNQTTMVEPVAAPEPKPLDIEEAEKKQTEPKPVIEPVQVEKADAVTVNSTVMPTVEESQLAAEESKPVEKPPVYTKVMKHKVGVGETLYRISLAYYHTGKFATFLAKHNKLKNPTELVSGSIIEVPFPPN
ncbi:hypothetical protein [Ammoniphilus resinae]|uniref:LysM domain-containing protein n=1 Tax=Ammoniphilus resinae TaxID=861532 RepID=A0ABS4GT92_9BACL|nr:hypothetical protein [Ammoniphilus resinae]MBP1933493.1 hypothetical protein [Ammoniphilus resinae]